MDIGVSNTVVMRDQFGRFRQQLIDAAEPTITELVTEGAKESIRLAPSGSKVDPRTSKLKASIRPVVFSRTSGAWIASARHALPVEYGAGPHPITGYVLFFWDKMNRMWNPGPNMIQHPGNRAQPYLRPAYDIMAGRAMSIVKKHYGG
jgi:hypothetical protein